MAFKSDSFLQRHVKYSDLHITNAARLKNGEAIASAPIASATTIEGTSTATAKISNQSFKNDNNQVEGQHLKLLYIGSKFFWRTKDNIDLHFYHHLLPNTIEIICYDVINSKEISRIYLKYDVLLDNVLKTHKLNEDLREDEAKRALVTTYILQRLQLQASSSQMASDSIVVSNRMHFVKLTGDEQDISPILDLPSIALIPVIITRRRRTNAEEIDAIITSLVSDREALVQATGNAEKIANLVYSSASQFASKKKCRPDFSKPRKLWLWAIRRQIRQMLVAETKVNLAYRGLPYSSEPGKSLGQVS
jgi:hypothetical protein